MSSQQPHRPTQGGATSRMSTIPSQKPRQHAHLHAQLAQLASHLSDLDNLLRMTAVQAESMRGLGGYAGAMFMASSKVLGEETINQAAQQQEGSESKEQGRGT